MAKLGSYKNPAVVRVQHPDDAHEILEICKMNGWQVIIGVEPDKPEDISDVEKLLYPPIPLKFDEPKIGRNELCVCGSGKKYKKCCLNMMA
jgi:SWIM/SEC-C metal-binding protein